VYFPFSISVFSQAAQLCICRKVSQKVVALCHGVQHRLNKTTPVIAHFHQQKAKLTATMETETDQFTINEDMAATTPALGFLKPVFGPFRVFFSPNTAAGFEASIPQVERPARFIYLPTHDTESSRPAFEFKNTVFTIDPSVPDKHFWALRIYAKKGYLKVFVTKEKKKVLRYRKGNIKNKLGHCFITEAPPTL
jgi:hypothetical protein